MPRRKQGGRNDVYFAELGPMTISPDAELPGFRNGSEVLVLVNDYEAARRHVFTKSSTGAYLTDGTVGSVGAVGADGADGTDGSGGTVGKVGTDGARSGRMERSERTGRSGGDFCNG